MSFIKLEMVLALCISFEFGLFVYGRIERSWRVGRNGQKGHMHNSNLISSLTIILAVVFSGKKEQLAEAAIHICT